MAFLNCGNFLKFGITYTRGVADSLSSSCFEGLSTPEECLQKGLTLVEIWVTTNWLFWMVWAELVHPRVYGYTCFRHRECRLGFLLVCFLCGSKHNILHDIDWCIWCIAKVGGCRYTMVLTFYYITIVHCILKYHYYLWEKFHPDIRKVFCESSRYLFYKHVICQVFSPISRTFKFSWKKHIAITEMEKTYSYSLMKLKTTPPEIIIWNDMHGQCHGI